MGIFLSLALFLRIGLPRGEKPLDKRSLNNYTYQYYLIYQNNKNRRHREKDSWRL